jgi:hypothetical protein
MGPAQLALTSETTCRMVRDFLNFKDILTIRHPFSETSINNKGPNEASKRVGDYSHIFSSQKLRHWKSCVLTVSHLVLVPPKFWLFLAEMLRMFNLTCFTIFGWEEDGLCPLRELLFVVCHNSKSRFHHVHFQCNCPVNVPELNTNALFPQAAITKLHFICTKTNYSLRGNRDDYSWKNHYTGP